MNNQNRQAIYLRDRAVMTPAQRRRVGKHDRQAVAQFSRSTRRAAKRDVLRRDRNLRSAIRAYFRRAA
jgi:hypothetical protein